ncbi:MAG: hypothetical protein HYV63_32440 [Candidatus Schekmanbacteria bacterium]|nr:hypothetical protein [Candidatus Schekmanbacteria bacterium]
MGKYAHLATVVSFLPAIATGLLNAAHYPDDPLLLARVATHRDVMLASARRAIYLGIITIAALLVLAGGHLGGQLALGETYLPLPWAQD